MITRRKTQKDTWRVGAIVGKNADGTYKRVTITVHGKKIDAKIAEAKLKAKIKAGEYVANSKITFYDFSEVWENNHGKMLAPKTYQENRRLLKVINQYIGDYSLVKITPLVLNSFYMNLRARGKQTRTGKFEPLSGKTINNYYSLINGMFNKAIEWDYISVNPNKKATKPKVVKYHAKAYNTEQAMELLNCVKNECLKYQAIIYLGTDTGAREGELTGLDWEDINFKTRKIRINKVTQYVNNQIIEKQPKNNSSIRETIVTTKTIEVLKAYKEEQDEKKYILGDKWEKTSKVFTTENGGLMFPSTPYKILKRIQAKYNLEPISFHALRHTLTSLLANEGVPLPVISQILGHSDITTTAKIYTHIFDEAKIEAKQKLEKIII